MTSQNMTTKCIFIHQVISLDFEWIHQSHWTGFSGYTMNSLVHWMRPSGNTMNSLIHWMRLMNCCHISDIQWIPQSHWTRPNGDTDHSLIHWMGLRTSPPVLSMWLESVKFIAKKPKCACLAQEIGVF
jgi:hypothetical protein